MSNYLKALLVAFTLLLIWIANCILTKPITTGANDNNLPTNHAVPPKKKRTELDSPKVVQKYVKHRDYKGLKSYIEQFDLNSETLVLRELLNSDMPEWSKPELVYALLLRIKNEKPEYLLEILDSLPKGGVSEESVAKLFRTFDPVQLRDTINLLNSMKHSEWKKRARESIVFGISHRIEAGLLSLDQKFINDIVLLDLEPGEIGEILSTKPHEGEGNLSGETLSLISDLGIRTEVEIASIEKLSNESAIELLNRVSDNNQYSPKIKPRDVRMIAEEFSKRNPIEAATWATSQLSGEIQQTAAYFAISSWYRSSPSDASAFIDQLAPSDVKDSAITSVVDSILMNGSNSDALSWLDQVKNDRARQELRSRIQAQKSSR